MRLNYIAYVVPLVGRLFASRRKVRRKAIRLGALGLRSKDSVGRHCIFFIIKVKHNMIFTVLLLLLNGYNLYWPAKTIYKRQRIWQNGPLK